MRFVAAFFCLLLQAYAAEYYVATTGSDTTGDGSVGSPWATLTKAKTNAVAGDIVHVASGQYNERVELTADGAAGNPITFIGPSDRSATNYGFYLNGADYITIQWFSCSNNVAGVNGQLYTGSGIDNEGHHNSIISNTCFLNSGCGIFSYDAPSIGISATNTLLQGNICYSNIEVGIFMCAGTGSTVRWNEVYGTMNTNSRTTAVWNDADGMHLFGDGLLVESNYIHGLWWKTNDPYNMGAGVHVDALQSWEHIRGGPGMRNCTMRGNIFDTPLIASCVMWSGCSNNWVYNNVFRGHRIMTISYDTPYYNFEQHIYNNTFIVQLYDQLEGQGDEASGISINQLNGGYDVLTNNIIVTDNLHPVVYAYSGTDLEGGNNLFYRTTGAVNMGSGYTVKTTDITNSSPLLPNAYSVGNLTVADIAIPAGSPAIGSGANLSSLFSVDIAGTARGAVWDIGAFEYVAPPTPGYVQQLNVGTLRIGP